MSIWWLLLAFVGGMAFMWKVAARLTSLALGRSLIFAQALSRQDYDVLLRQRAAIDRELAKRNPPGEAVA